MTLYFANTLAGKNPGMTFCYVSGFGATPPGKAGFMQAKVKWLTETDLIKTSLRKVYSFRPGLLKPVRGQNYVHRIYYLFKPFYPVFRYLFPGFVLSLNELAVAMIKSATDGYYKKILEVKDIISVSK